MPLLLLSVSRHKTAEIPLPAIKDTVRRGPPDLGGLPHEPGPPQPLVKLDKRNLDNLSLLTAFEVFIHYVPQRWFRCLFSSLSTLAAPISSS